MHTTYSKDNMAEELENIEEETVGEALDQIVEDVDKDAKKPFTRIRHKRRGVIPKFRKRLHLMRTNGGL